MGVHRYSTWLGLELNLFGKLCIDPRLGADFPVKVAAKVFFYSLILIVTFGWSGCEVFEEDCFPEAPSLGDIFGVVPDLAAACLMQLDL